MKNTQQAFIRKSNSGTEEERRFYNSLVQIADRSDFMLCLRLGDLIGVTKERRVLSDGTTEDVLVIPMLSNCINPSDKHGRLYLAAIRPFGYANNEGETHLLRAKATRETLAKLSKTFNQHNLHLQRTRIGYVVKDINDFSHYETFFTERSKETLKEAVKRNHPEMFDTDKDDSNEQ